MPSVGFVYRSLSSADPELFSSRDRNLSDRYAQRPVEIHRPDSPFTGTQTAHGVALFICIARAWHLCWLIGVQPSQSRRGLCSFRIRSGKPRLAAPNRRKMNWCLRHNGAAGASGSYSPQPTLVLVRARREAWVRGHVQVSDDAVPAAISFRSLLAS